MSRSHPPSAARSHRLRRPRPAASSEYGLTELAEAVGIQTSYIDMAGVRQHASAIVLKALLPFWGIQIERPADIARTFQQLDLERWRTIAPPVIVAWGGRARPVPLHLPSHAMDCPLELEVILEEGQNRRLRPGALAWQNRRCGNNRFVRTSLRLPALPLGYHQLEVRSALGVYRSLIISAPKQAWSPEDPVRAVGVFAPVYAVHSGQSWGAGDLRDWTRFAKWAHGAGCSVIATLPLLGAFLDHPICEPSPYSPASRLFWNDFYIAIEQVPEFCASPAARQLFKSPRFQQRLARLRADPFIDYPAQAQLRRTILEPMARHFFRNISLRHRSYQEFVRQRPELIDYASFRALCDETNASWHTWDERLRGGDLREADCSAVTRQYHSYCQWVIQDQMSAFLREARARHQHFYLDLPLGVHPDGYDLWRYRDAFAFPASAGAPPDPYFTKGQNWGFAPLHPAHMQRRHYDYWLKFIRFQMRHTGLLRIDHVMSLHRLYWIPKDLPASEGAYVTYPADQLQAMLCLESVRNQTILVGENLGTVPPAVNRDMQRHRIREIYALQYEQQPDERRPFRPPPRLSVAGINTHDMPPFAAHVLAQDLKLRSQLGLLTRRQVVDERIRRERLTNALTGFFQKLGLLPEGSPDPVALLAAALKSIAMSDAEIALTAVEDLWGETRPQNVPGTSIEMPNWRRKLSLTLEDLEQAQQISRLLRDMAKARKVRKSNSP